VDDWRLEMDPTLPLSGSARSTAGVLLLTIVAVEFGGTYLLRIARGRLPRTPFQHAFERAGHAHAGVLVILALVCQLFADAVALSGPAATLARSGVAIAAILMPAGFFLSAAGRDRTGPNRLVVMIWAGAASLAAGVVTLGVGLVTSG
jgi:hypothetical protein